jgi:hypothetical protein
VDRVELIASQLIRLNATPHRGVVVEPLSPTGWPVAWAIPSVQRAASSVQLRREWGERGRRGGNMSCESRYGANTIYTSQLRNVREGVIIPTPASPPRGQRHLPRPASQHGGQRSCLFHRGESAQ